MQQQISLQELWPTVQEILSKGGSFRLYPGGTSMLPTVRPGEDSVLLVPLPNQVRPFDVLLFRRENGQFVLHRVVAVRTEGGEEVYDFLGDNQYYIEKGIRRAQLLALAEGRYREEVYTPFRDPRLMAWTRRRWRSFPLRAFFGKVKNRLCRTIQRG